MALLKCFGIAVGVIFLALVCILVFSGLYLGLTGAAELAGVNLEAHYGVKVFITIFSLQLIVAVAWSFKHVIHWREFSRHVAAHLVEINLIFIAGGAAIFVGASIFGYSMIIAQKVFGMPIFITGMIVWVALGAVGEKLAERFYAHVHVPLEKWASKP